MKSLDGKMLQLGEITPLVNKSITILKVAIEIKQSNHSDSKEIVVLTASNSFEQKKLLLEIDVHWTNEEGKTQEVEESGFSKQ